MSYVGNAMINWAMRGTMPPSPPANWLALVTENGEVVGGGYARVNVSSMFAAPDADDTTSNLSRIDFPVPSAAWGTVTGAVIYDAAEGGNILIGGAIATPVNVPANTPVYWNAGQLKLSITVDQG